MIKFFRKIRQDLLSTGKTGKYFKYAIGEIVLVVIGILIALSINNWNQTLKNRKAEKHILESLHNEFLLTKKELRRKQKRYEEKKIVWDELNKLVGQEKSDIDRKYMDSLLSKSEAYPTFNPPDGVVLDIINSGKVSLIQNTELREAITSWNGVVMDINKNEDSQANFMLNQYMPYINDNVELLYARAKWYSLEEAKSFGPDPRLLLKDFRYANLLRRNLYWHAWITGQYKIVEKKIDKILEMTKNSSELNNEPIE